jgi:hypothetical protein
MIRRPDTIVGRVKAASLMHRNRENIGLLEGFLECAILDPSCIYSLEEGAATMQTWVETFLV